MTSDPPSQTPAVRPQEDPGSPSPRAFAMGTGFVFQAVGMLFLLASCVLWLLGSHFVEAAPEPATQWTDYLSGEQLPAAMLAIIMLTSFVGALGLVAVGVGLQGERRGSGRLAMIVTALMCVTYAGASLVLANREGLRFHAILPAIFALVSVVLFALAGHSATVLRRFPPPPDQHVVTEEFLQERREERARGREL